MAIKIVTLIPARSGSKGLPDKNIAKINGKTLIEHTIISAQKVDFLKDIYISTDSKQYEDIALSCGASSLGLRKKSLSEDHAKSIDVAIDFIQSLNENFTHLLLLQPTSPFRKMKDYTSLLTILKNQNPSSIVSVEKLEEPHPYKLKVIENGYLKPFINNSSSEIPRQNLPPVYKLNGCFYLISISSLLESKTFFPVNTVPYIMPPTINIDSKLDLQFAEFLASTHEKN